MSEFRKFGSEEQVPPGKSPAGPTEIVETEDAIRKLAAIVIRDLSARKPSGGPNVQDTGAAVEYTFPSIEDRYRVLVEQIPAVLFIVFLEGGLSEAYVSPQIERILGFSQEEWLDDPIRWYHQIHPDDRARWSLEAAEMFLSGKPLKSVYRVIARDGRVVWFHCEAKLVRRKDGQPWFIHGVGFDVTELKETEQALQRESAEHERLQKVELERQIAKAAQTESRLTAIFESSQDAIIGKSLDGIITDWNAAATRLFGYQPEEILGKPVLVLVPPELHQREIDMLQRLRAGEHLAPQEMQGLTKDGTRVDVSLTVSPIRDAAGRVIGGSSIVRDITEQKRSERALRDSEERFRSVFEQSTAGIAQVDLTGRFVLVNDHYCEIVGRSREELLELQIEDVTHPDDRDRKLEQFFALARGGPNFAIENRYVRPDGSHVWVKSYVCAIRDVQGKVTYITAAVVDITDRILAEQALRESEERFRSMAETAADAIFRINEASIILFANPATEKIFGYKPEELVGKELTILMPDCLRELHRAGIARYVQGGGKRHVDWGRFEVVGLHKDGREISLEVSLGESADRRLFTGFVRDVTERKQIEEKLRITEKLAATGRLAATISHEINNPLEAITNFVYLAKQDPSLGEATRQLLEGADRELQRVVHISRQTLGFYRDTSRPVRINVAELLSDIIELYRSKIAYRKLRLCTRFDRSCEVHALQGDLRQVFANILANAIEASPENGTLTLRVAAGRDWKSPERSIVRVSFCDQGPGIPAQARARIFEPFYSTKRDIGTGLGLWVSKSLIEKHGGLIRFRSSLVPGRSGTLFSVLLPFGDAAKQSARAA